MDITTLPCPICGQTNYELGKVADSSQLGQRPLMYFAAKDSGFFSLFKGHVVDKARRCLSCGHVALFISEPTSKRPWRT